MKNIGTVELESNRLLFRKASTSDSNAMFNNWANDKEVTKYLRWDAYEKEEDTIKFLNYLENSYKEDNFYNWMVIPKEERVPIGTIGAVDIDVNNNTVEIGHCYGRNFWNKGYGTEALTRIIKFFFEEVGVETIYAYYVEGNSASGKVLEKVGMRQDAILRNRQINEKSGVAENKVVYSILKEEFKRI